MARFKIFPTLTNKVKKATQRLFAKAGKRSVEWFRDKLIGAFGNKNVRDAGAFTRDELKAQQDAASAAARAKKPKPQGRPAPRPSGVDPDVLAGRRQSPEDDARGIRGGSLGNAMGKNTAFDAEFKKNVKQVSRPLIGHMYFYIYDPKWKQILPYYDVFPLVIPINYYPDGFLGMNLHYLPYILRAQLLDFLMSLEKSTGGGQKYMDVSYGVLKSLGASKPYEPTIKRYLFSHVKSPFAEVHSDEWENAAFLPVEQFRKANKREVWKDSRSA